MFIGHAVEKRFWWRRIRSFQRLCSTRYSIERDELRAILPRLDQAIASGDLSILAELRALAARHAENLKAALKAPSGPRNRPRDADSGFCAREATGSSKPSDRNPRHFGNGQRIRLRGYPWFEQVIKIHRIVSILGAHVHIGSVKAFAVPDLSERHIVCG